MDAWIELARGPLFRISLVVCLLGLVLRFGLLAAHVAAAWRRAADRRLPLDEIAAATLSWLLPVRLLRTRPLYSAASFLFHVGILVVPLLLSGHVALLAGWLPAAWPTLDPLLSDALTLLALVALGVVLGGRLGSRMSRALSRFEDVAVVLILLLVLLAGFLASHPGLSPLPARTMLLAHILLGNLALVLTPTTKIAHCVLYPLTQLVFQLGWRFPAATGQHVAIALDKENEPV
jgi:hypothetical protein